MKYLFLFFITLCSIQSIGQIQDDDYSKMLDDLLDHSVAEIGVKEAHAKRKGFVFLDARAKEEFDVSHIKNARWVGYDNFTLDRIQNLLMDDSIVIYCSVGYRSEKISEQLIEAGYLNVRNLYGSIFEWVNQGYPVYDNKGILTEKIHAYDKEWGKWITKGEKVYD